MYRKSKSMEGANLHALHSALDHQNTNKNTNIRLLFIDHSSTFTIILNKLIAKLLELWSWGLSLYVMTTGFPSVRNDDRISVC